MADIRRVHGTKEMNEAIRLANDTFRDDDQMSMGDAFPHAFSTSLQQSFGAFINNQLAAFSGLFPSTIHIGNAYLDVYSLGPVCTDEKYRGEGLAGGILEKIIHHVEQSGASLMFISGRRSLYTRNHCHLFGSEAVLKYTLNMSSINILSQNLKGKENFKVREMQAEDWLKLKKIAEKRSVRFEQSVWDLAQLIHADGVASNFKLTNKVLVAEKNADIIGFMVVGVPYGPSPTRLPFVIESAGDQITRATLAVHAFKNYQLHQLIINVGWHEQNLIELLNPIEYEREYYTGTIRVINSEKLISQLRPYLNEKDSNSSEKLTIHQLEDLSTEVVIDGGNRYYLNSQEFTSLLFDREHQFLNDPVLDQLFPIPLPHPQGLNYV